MSFTTVNTIRTYLRTLMKLEWIRGPSRGLLLDLLLLLLNLLL